MCFTHTSVSKMDTWFRQTQFQDVRTLIMTIQEQLWRLVLYKPYLPNVHIL